MARSAILHLLAACLYTHTEGASAGQDGNGQEYFPLSGGIAEGVKVTIKADKVNMIGRLDFLTPSREVAVKWLMDAETQTVSRTRGDNVPQTWGGWGLDADIAIVLEFYKTKSTFQVSVGTGGGAPVRFPWFDIYVEGAGLMTHVSVYDGFENVEVVQSRPICTAVCHSTECRGAGGCPGENTTCYSTNGRTCGSGTETGVAMGFGWSCCDGLPKGISVREENKDMWVELDSDADFLNSACTAYNIESKQCGDFAGKKGKITGADLDSGSYKVWVPSAVEQEHDYDVNISTFTLPSLTLQLSSGVTRKYLRLEDGQAVWTCSGEKPCTFKLDPHNSLIYSSTSASEALGVSRGWFVNMVAYSLSGVEWRWFDYSIFDEDLIKRKAFIMDLVITDEHIPGPVCNGDLRFQSDDNNLTCADYTQNSYCTTNGEASQEWCDTYSTKPDRCSFYNGATDNTNGLTPAHQCCACGGGNISAPVEALPPPPLLFNQ